MVDENQGGKKEDGAEKKVVILLCDMVRYSQKTADMRPNEIRDFILEYHRNLQKIIQVDGHGHQEIEASAGDGAIAIFEKRRDEAKADMYSRAVKAAIKMAYAMEEGVIPLTRIGIFAGDIIEAQLGTQKMKFGASFSVASRLEELCEYFGTSFLMDREVAFWQTHESKYLVSIGKVTPKNFNHPIHAFTIYKPGIHNCPPSLNEGDLFEFIETKNRAIELFCGNTLQGILPDFLAARARLNEAQSLFSRMTGKKDVATERILEYIRNISFPTEDFKNVGMKIREVTGGTLGISLLHLSNELLKAMDVGFYQALVVDTDWERHFKPEWKRKGEVIIRVNEPPDGIYYIDNGSVNALDEDGNLITTLAAGNVFGEMAYFSKRKRRTATIIANSDVMLRRISGEEFAKQPVIKKIFHKIASKRKNKL
jgi:class 3 adenylate cyclase